MAIANDHGRTLKLFLVHGSSASVVIAGLGVSTVLTLVAPRWALAQLLARQESKRTGVYLLVGPDPQSPARSAVYVGEGDDVALRLIQHDKDSTKEFFERVCLVVSRDEDFTKAHCRYLESRLIAIIKATSQARVTNGTEPASKGLPEAEVADMERVLAEIELVLPTLGFDIMRSAPSIATTAVSRTEPGPVWRYFGSGFDARGREEDGLFIVAKGSLARAVEVPSASEGLKTSRALLLQDGKVQIVNGGQGWEFVQDVAFKSPSAAGCAVYGGNVSGPQYWKNARTGRTYGEWREAQLQQAAAGEDR